MVKLICDKCGNEVDINCVSDRFHWKNDRFEFELVIAVDGTWNKGHLCEECVKKMVMEFFRGVGSGDL